MSAGISIRRSFVACYSITGVWRSSVACYSITGVSRWSSGGERSETVYRDHVGLSR